MAWGRLALIEAAKEGTVVLNKVARLHDYVSIEVNTRESQKQGKTGTSSEAKKDASTESERQEEKRPPAQFVYVKNFAELYPDEQNSHDYLNDPSLQLQDDGDATRTYQFDPPRRLLTSAQLVPFLHNSLSLRKAGKKIDQAVLGRYLAQGKAIEKLPVKPVQRWPAQVEIIVDVGEHLRPYWKDFKDIITETKRVLGNEGVRSYRIGVSTKRGERLKRLMWPTGSNVQWEYWELPSNDVPILILSDFGVTEKQGDSDVFWWRFAKGLQKHTAPIITLSPALAAPKCLKTCSLVSISPLRDTFSMPRHALVNGFKQQGLSADITKSILVLLSPLPIVDVGLLRKLRDSFDWGASFIEAQLWNHQDVESGPLGIRVRTDLAKQYSKLFRQQVSSEDADRLWDIVHEHHNHAFQGLRQFEKLNHALTTSANVDSAQTQSYLRQLCATTSQSPKGSRRHSALEAQCRTYLAAQPDDIWVGEFSEVFYDLCAMAYESEIQEGKLLPISSVHFQPEKLKWLLDEKEQLDYESWHVEQISSNGELRFNRDKEIESTHSPIHRFESLKKVTPIAHFSDGSTVPITPSLSIVLSDGESIILSLEKHRFELSTMAKPSWASSIKNRDGALQASFAWSDQIINCHWRYIVGKGLWSVEYPFGFDRYGLYVEIPLSSELTSNLDLTQRFRWIPPGTFQMGSPEIEPERSGDETQHQVTLTQGYWLADTTVTQAQWQAIMGQNPSHFEGSNLPVEQVSWDDSKNFIQKLNKVHESLNFQLPTEAQWEYACRAGTTTPFSFGDNVTTEQVNYNGEYPYNNGREGEYRNRTVPVRSLPCNEWGLYEMHGNVIEWCLDRSLEGLGKKTVVEPEPQLAEPEKNTFRVARGGSWNEFGQQLRSADRSIFPSSVGDARFGLRLAIGPPNAKSQGGSWYSYLGLDRHDLADSFA